MKLSFIEISGFRGFRDKTRFDIPSGFVVLSGRNGAGKSTVLDAFDFALTGSINKYTVKDAKGGGLNEHIWWIGDDSPERQYASVGFKNEAGDEFVITRSRERGLETSFEEISNQFNIGEIPTSTWFETLVQTTLIRDELITNLSIDLSEQARFTSVRAAIRGLAGPDYTKRTGVIVSEAANAKSVQERRVVEAQAELGRSLTALTEAQSTAKRQSDVAEAEQIIEAHAPEISATGGDRIEHVRRFIAEWKQSTQLLDEALMQAEILQAERLKIESETGEAEIEKTRAELSAAMKAKELADQNLANTRLVEAAESEKDIFANTMFKLLMHGETLGLQDGHCPLCSAVRTPEEFAEAISTTKSKLSTHDYGVGARAFEAVVKALEAVKQATTELTGVQARLEKLEAQRYNFTRRSEELAKLLTQWNIPMPTSGKTMHSLLLERREVTAKLEQALYILEASSAHDRARALEVRVEQLRVHLNSEIAKLSTAEQAVEIARQLNNAAIEVPNQVLAEQFDTVMPLLKELYQRIRPHTDWREIEIDFGGRVRASLNFTVGEGHNPQFLFSSGQRRAMGLAFLLAIHLSRPWCRLRSLLLDDPVQHIDDFRALNLVEVLSSVRRTGRQVIIAVEDPALADVLCRRLRSTTLEQGRRFELHTTKEGSAAIEQQVDILPLPREILRTAEI